MQGFLQGFLDFRRALAAALLVLAGVLTPWLASTLTPSPAAARGALSQQPVVVSFTSFRSNDPYDVVFSNVTFLNTLFDNFIDIDEVPRDAARSYFVDFYIAQVNNGGFAHFVHNSGWQPEVVALVRDGLGTIGAVQHLAVFNSGARIVNGLSEAQLNEFLDSDLWGANPLRDRINEVNDAFFALSNTEDVVKLNSEWLRGLTNLELKSSDELNEEVARRVAMIPNLEARRKEALESEPRHMKLIRALAAEVGQQFSHVTATDPNYEHQGVKTAAWHFMTNQGQHYMIEVGGKALLYQTKTRSKIAEINAPAQ